MKKVSLLLLVIFLLAGCSTGDKADNASSDDTNNSVNNEEYQSDTYDPEEEENTEVKYQTLNSDEVQKLIANNDIVIIDVRSEEAYLEKHIPNSLNIPLDDLEAKIPELNKNGDYLMVCKLGKTSQKASQLLTDNGFENIYNFGDGMEGWTGDVE